MKTIVTIGREFCTGGLDIARQVAQELGVPCYDKELITLAAKKSGLSEETVAATEARRTGSLLYSLYTLGGELPLDDQVYIIQSQVIADLAKQGPCVIVGRCADYVLRQNPHLLSVFLHAPVAYRRQWGTDTAQLPQGLEERHLNQAILREDKRRASYYNYYTELRWGEASNYDLCLNAALGRDLCAQLILDAARAKK